MVHLSKRYLNLAKVLVTDWFDDYKCKGDIDSTTGSFVYLWDVSKESNSVNQIIWDYLTEASNIHHKVDVTQPKFLPLYPRAKK